MNLRTMFALRRTSDVLSKVRDAATALAFAGGRLTPLSAIGILTHVAAFVVGVSSRDLTSIATKWPQSPSWSSSPAGRSRLRLLHLQGAQADVEVAELQRRAAEALGAAAEGKS